MSFWGCVGFALAHGESNRALLTEIGKETVVKRNSRGLVELRSKPCDYTKEIKRQSGACYECPADGDALRGFVKSEPEGGLGGDPVVRISCYEKGYEGSLPTQLGNLLAMTRLDVCCNKLTSTLPTQVVTTSPIHLNLSTLPLPP